MAKTRIMVFRTSDDDKHKIWTWLQKGELHQGWGISGLQLIENGKIVPLDLWTKRYRLNGQEYWKSEISDEEATTRYRILLLMAQLSKDDIVVIPKMPDWTTLTIARVDCGYEFDSAQRPEPSTDDFRHVIRVAKESIRTYSYSLSEEARIIKKKIRGYQRALNNVLDPDFIMAVEKLFSLETNITKKTPLELFGETKRHMISEILGKLRGRDWRDLEALLTAVFQQNGFTIEERNSFDKKGGDADVVATMAIPVIEDVTDFDLKIYIQVKHKDGIDHNDIEGVRQLQRIAEGEKNCLKVLVSTAEEFTQEAKYLAEQQNIILINGMGVAELLTRYL